MPLQPLEDALARNDPDELLRLAVSIALDPPEDTHPGEAERLCLILARHPHFNVRGNAILGFGHLARTTGVIRAEAEVRGLVAKALNDPDDYVRSQAASAASDLAFFLNWKF